MDRGVLCNYIRRQPSHSYNGIITSMILLSNAITYTGNYRCDMIQCHHAKIRNTNNINIDWFCRRSCFCFVLVMFFPLYFWLHLFFYFNFLFFKQQFYTKLYFCYGGSTNKAFGFPSCLHVYSYDIFVVFVVFFCKCFSLSSALCFVFYFLWRFCDEWNKDQ